MTNNAKQKTALIIGASRGLGLALVEEYLKRGWRVIATERSADKSGLRTFAPAIAENLEIETLDVNNRSQVTALKSKLTRRTLDFLFVNSGVSDGATEKIGDVSDETFYKIMMTNALSPMRIIESLHDRVPATGTIGVMSSGLASVASNNEGGWEVYRASKAALNTMLKSFAARSTEDRRTYLAVAPGWVRTEMGGPQATLSIDESIPRLTDVMIAQEGKPGVQFLSYEGQPLSW